MGILVAVRPGHRNGGALALAGELADALGEAVVAVAVVVVPLGVPSPLRDGMADEDYFALIAASAMDEARAVLGGRLAETSAIGARSVRAGLLGVVERRRATRLVLGSSERGELGRTRVGDVASGILHASGVPVHLAPAGYERVFSADPVRRVTVAFDGGDGGRQAVEFGAVLADHADSMLRAVTFFVRDNASASVVTQGYGAQISEAWHEQMAEAMGDAVRSAASLGLPTRFVSSEFGDGTSWRAAIDAIDWAPGDHLVVGPRQRGAMRSVSLGSRAIRILHRSPVPVVVVPA